MKRAGRVLLAMCIVAMIVTLWGCGGGNSAVGTGVETAAHGGGGHNGGGGGGGTPPPSTPSRIAFTCRAYVTKKTTQTTVRTMNSDGTGVVTLLPGAEPAWSPDGTRIAYVADAQASDGTMTACIWTMNPDGSGQQQVTTPARYVTQWWDDWSADSEPAWSPDGSQIVFTRGIVSNGYPYSIQTVSSGGGDPTLVVEISPDTDGMLFCPSWSAMNRIAFHACPVTGGYLVEAVNPEGSGRVVLLPDGRYPAWSPDGTKLAVNRVGTNQGLYVYDYDGASNSLSGPKQLTTFGIDCYPTWSRDGTEIAFSSWPPGATRQDVYKVSAADGSNRVCLTASLDAISSAAPDWSPAVFGGS